MTHSTRSNLIELVNISKAYCANNARMGTTEAVTDLNLSLEEGQLVTVFGPNGCGKSTILNILAGIIEPDSGKVIRNTHDLNPISVGYVFQNHGNTLLPWRTVRENLAFPLEIRKIARSEQRDRVNQSLAQFHLAEHSEKYIYQLSGGLKQLISVARSTIYNPDFLILDEPFSSLDYSLSRVLWLQFREFWGNRKMTGIFVSHNIDEAIFLGDRVIVLSSRPATILADINVAFGAQRSLSLLQSSKFFALRNQILNIFDSGRMI